MQKAFTETIKTAVLMLAVTLVGAFSAQAQVTVEFEDVAGRQGETATVAVEISGVEDGTAIQSFGFTVASDPGVTFTGIDDTGTLAGAAGFTSDANAVNGTVGGFATGTNITSSGTLINLTFDLDALGSGTVTFSNFEFNDGDPAAVGSFDANFVVSDRIIAVQNTIAGTEQDFVIVVELEDALVDADDVVSFDFELNYDPSLITINGVVTEGTLTEGTVSNGNDLDADTYLVGGFATGSEITGVGPFIIISATSLGATGVDFVSLSNVRFNDGTPVYAAKSGRLQILEGQVNQLSANLSGLNHNPAIDTDASGTASVLLVEATGQLDVTVSSGGFGSDITAAHIHTGAIGENGGVLQPLEIASDGSVNQTFDVTGNTDLIEALQNGTAYINVHTVDNPDGEIRGQLLPSTNAAPTAPAQVNGASMVTVTGDPTDPLFSISWNAGSDPDGDTVHYVFEASTDENFTDSYLLVYFGETTGQEFTVEEMAAIVDELSGDAVPGNTATLYHRVWATDGSLLDASASRELVITRGEVTDTETGSELPAEFALKGNYPNPFNPSTNIQFDLPETADVSIRVLDMLGREVLSVPTQTMDAGSNRSVQISASSLASGIYLYRVIARTANSTDVKTGTMTLMK